MKPNFLVAGAAKAGTTWLHYCLEVHPEVFVPKQKELHFFSYPRLYEKGTEWYESFFREGAAKKAVGEVSPSYMPSPEAPSRIQNYNPNMRLIFILRNPIERAYSHYCMDMRIGKVSTDINAGLSPQNPRVTSGLYYSKLTQYLKLFPSEQIKIFLFDDIKNHPETLLAELYAFLEVDSSFKPLSLSKAKNTKKSLPKFPILYKYLKGVYEGIISRSEFSRGLLTQLRLRGYFDLFHKLNQGSDFPRLSKEKERRLAEFYFKDVVDLSDLIGRDLSFWLMPYLENSKK